MFCLLEVNKTNPAFTEHTGKMVVFYLPAVKHGYSRQLVGIGQHGSVYVSQEFKNSYVGDRSYMFLKSGYDRYGFQYVRYSDGRTSPVGAEFSVGKYLRSIKRTTDAFAIPVSL